MDNLDRPGFGSPATAVVVTGGASGIGRACAEALLQVGRPVAIWDRSAEAAQDTAERLGKEYAVPAMAVSIDLAAEAGISRAVAATTAALGSVGGLVHAAGLLRRESLEELDEEGWDLVNDVNVRAGALLARALFPTLRAAGPGSSIVLISSMLATFGHPSAQAYCASKGAVLGLMHSLAVRLAADGIRVNAVCPGMVETPMVGDTAAERLALLEQRAIPLKRSGQPAEIARVVRFLLSDEASYMTGAEVAVDGGASRLSSVQACG